jgi:mono/diheme cytochrome c family protein
MIAAIAAKILALSPRRWHLWRINSARFLLCEGGSMLKPVLFVLAACIALGAQEIKKGNIQPTPPGSGKEMFEQYCAVCHGKEAKGNGPAAEALKKRPADLTQLARKNNGTFPELRVINFISGDSNIAAHGSRDMPMWGHLFQSLSPNDQGVVKIRLANLTDYIKSLQAQ